MNYPDLFTTQKAVLLSGVRSQLVVFLKFFRLFFLAAHEVQGVFQQVEHPVAVLESTMAWQPQREYHHAT